MTACARDVPPPTWHWAPPATRSLGAEVADVAALAGFAPDAAQRLILDTVFAEDRWGRPQVRDVGIAAPRQNVKTGSLKMCALGWLYVTETPLIVWSAHETDTSLEAFAEMQELICSTRDLERELAPNGIHRSKGHEAIELRNPKRILKFKARTSDGGRGLAAYRVVLDEAMKLRDEVIGALVPTLRAVPDPQLVFAGSAGTAHPQAATWRRLRDRGRAGGERRLAWIEWADRRAWQCAEPTCSHVYGRAIGCGLDDERRWWDTNTALTVGRIDIDSLRSDRKLMNWEQFAVETLGWWIDPPPEDEAGQLFPLWDQRVDTDILPAAGARMALGIDTSWDRSTTHIVAATVLPDGRLLVELVAHGPGTGWVPQWVADRMSRRPVAIALQGSGAPVSSLVEDLTRALPEGERHRVRALTATDMAKAAGDLWDRVSEGQLAHRAQRELDEAVSTATSRVMSGGAWWLDRATSACAPVVAMSAACWSLNTAPAQVPAWTPRRIR